MNSISKRLLAICITCLLTLIMVACNSTSDQINMEKEPTSAQVENKKDDKMATKRVKHELGETEIPLEPKRIVSINMEDILVNLGTELVLATPIQRQDYLNSTLEKAGVEIAEYTGEINFEAVIEANPDLIIASTALATEVYEKLEKIAPTIAYNRTNWRDSIVQIGEALNKEEIANEIVASQAKKVAEQKASITALIGEAPTVAFLRMQEKDLRLFYPSILSNSNPFAGYVSIAYAEEGLQWKADPYILEMQATDPDMQNATVSLEVLPKLSANHLFVVTLSSDGSDEQLQKTLEELISMEDSAVWSSIPAVKSGNVHILNMKNWLIDGPTAEIAKLDELKRVLEKQ